ncbi:hypothetical protein FIU87_08905 [Bacillus sp. THAF10]|uniref:thiol-disulfide oxidoreductase DCC family protein n=1 Tax=Bacillus sp. THAF10 TaxID=2587848 RepID=UPI001267910A|nr:thiol-disulfide oxidoreductase DCC family protein [Bacillus sp. THAF10]QFT88762.1 hypothetical protein FIU87_08905 [Bacillus sp. THAF10]
MVNSEQIILFDGVCNLCNSAVTFVIKRDKNEVFKFASLQSEAGKKLLRNKFNANEEFNSFFLVQGDKIYDKSSAALYVAKALNLPWKFLFPLILIPKPLRDMVYSFIANNRYKWFGKSESCMLPSPELKNRFL